MRLTRSSILSNIVLATLLQQCNVFAATPDRPMPIKPTDGQSKSEFIDDIISNMTVSDIVLQLHLMFADNIVGPKSDNSLWDQALTPAPLDTAVGTMHDWYPLNTSHYNDLQALNLERARLKIPFMHTGECLHGVGSFKQSMFPQSLAMAASWDTDLAHRVGSAIGTEARSIGLHACFSPVLDVCQDPRWGRCQEDWGEDHILTSHMGVAYASGLSKNSSWSRTDAVAPVMKHFAAHGAPQGGHNAAPFMGHGNRQVLQNLLTPFHAAVDLGGVRGVMMAYSELDDVPSHVNPMLYDALEEWGYDGFVLADDTGMRMLETEHEVSNSPANTIMQWFNAGGMIQFYDYSLGTFLNATVDLVKNGSVEVGLLQSKMRHILGLKYDLGLFDDPYIPDAIHPDALTEQHVPLTLEAAHKSMVLLENKNNTLPLDLSSGNVRKVALIGPYGDILNYGDYSGQFGAYPVQNSSTLRQGLISSMSAANNSCELLTSTGANTWLYNAQYPIPGYHLSANGVAGGLHATYFADTNFSEPMVETFEVPVMDWGLYPPPGLPSNNFSAIWEGNLTAPVDGDIDGWLGVALNANTTAKLYVDDKLLVAVPLTTTGNILSNIPPREYSLVNSTAPPPGSEPFTFQQGRTYKIRLEYQAYNLYQKIENQSSLNAEVLLFWNLVDRTSPVEKAVATAQDADVIILAVGANWNSDGEGGDRGTMGLSANQTDLADAIFAIGKPVVMVLQGGRPFTISDYYNQSAAVLNAFFPGQSGGQAIADVLTGKYNPGGRLTVTVPRDIGQLPTYYNYKQTVHDVFYVDINSWPSYSFGYGLSYTNFTVGNLSATALGNISAHRTSNATFSAGDHITFTAQVTNTGERAGSHVPQVYLLQRVSQITQPVKQLVAFARVYLEAGESATVNMDLDVDRYLQILNRRYQWEVEKGEYTFALTNDGGPFADTSNNVTMACV